MMAQLGVLPLSALGQLPTSDNQSPGIEPSVQRNSSTLVTKASPIKRMFSIERSAALL